MALPKTLHILPCAWLLWAATPACADPLLIDNRSGKTWNVACDSLPEGTRIKFGWQSSPSALPPARSVALGAAETTQLKGPATWSIEPGCRFEIEVVALDEATAEAELNFHLQDGSFNAPGSAHGAAAGRDPGLGFSYDLTGTYYNPALRGRLEQVARLDFRDNHLVIARDAFPGAWKRRPIPVEVKQLGAGWLAGPLSAGGDPLTGAKRPRPLEEGKLEGLSEPGEPAAKRARYESAGAGSGSGAGLGAGSGSGAGPAASVDTAYDTGSSIGRSVWIGNEPASWTHAGSGSWTSAGAGSWSSAGAGSWTSAGAGSWTSAGAGSSTSASQAAAVKTARHDRRAATAKAAAQAYAGAPAASPATPSRAPIRIVNTTEEDYTLATEYLPATITVHERLWDDDIETTTEEHHGTSDGDCLLVIAAHTEFTLTAPADQRPFRVEFMLGGADEEEIPIPLLWGYSAGSAGAQTLAFRHLTDRAMPDGFSLRGGTLFITDPTDADATAPHLRQSPAVPSAPKRSPGA